MTAQVTPTATQPPPSPPGHAIPDDLIVAEWIDPGDVGEVGDGIVPAGDEYEVVDTLLGVLEDMWAFATRIGHYPGTALCAAADGRLYAVEGCVFGRPARPEEEEKYGRPAAVGTPRPSAPARAGTPPDHLGVTDLFCPGIYNPASARTVGEVRQEIWRNVLETFDGLPPVRPAAFVGEDGLLYIAEFGLVVRPACAATDRAAVEWEQGYLRQEAQDRIEQLGSYLKRMSG